MFTISVVRTGPKVLTITIDSPALTRMPILRRAFLPLEPGDNVDVAWGMWKRGVLLGAWSFDGNAVETPAGDTPGCADCELREMCVSDSRLNAECLGLYRLETLSEEIWRKNKPSTEQE